MEDVHEFECLDLVINTKSEYTKVKRSIVQELGDSMMGGAHSGHAEYLPSQGLNSQYPSTMLPLCSIRVT